MIFIDVARSDGGDFRICFFAGLAAVYRRLHSKKFKSLKGVLRGF